MGRDAGISFHGVERTPAYRPHWHESPETCEVCGAARRAAKQEAQATRRAEAREQLRWEQEFESNAVMLLDAVIGAVVMIYWAEVGISYLVQWKVLPDTFGEPAGARFIVDLHNSGADVWALLALFVVLALGAFGLYLASERRYEKLRAAHAEWQLEELAKQTRRDAKRMMKERRR